MHEFNVKDLMTTDVLTCSRSTSLRDVVHMLHDRRFSCLMITVDNKPAGIITERDMVTILADMLDDVSWDDAAIENFMTSPIITINEDLTLFEAVDMARMEKIRHLPVVNDADELVGILTQSNIVDGYYQASVDI